MKALLLAAFFCVHCSFCQTGKITTKGEAENFVKQKLKYKEFNIGDSSWHYAEKTDRGMADSIGVDYWKKADLDHNGTEDLFVMAYAETERQDGFEEVMILFSGKNQKIPVKIKLPHSFFVTVKPFPKIISINNLKYLQLTYKLTEKTVNCKEIKSYYTADTLFVKNNFLVPYSLSPNKIDFESIKIRTSNCFGSCPVFELIINHDRTSSYEGIEYTSKKGIFNLKADQKEIEMISLFLSHIDITTLKDSYSVCWTDSQTAYLTIVYNNGTVKKIEDYGLAGTYKLSLLYEYLFKLTEF